MPKTKIENSVDFEGQKFYVGLDVHKRSWSVAVRSLQLEVARFTQLPSVPALANTLRNKFPGGVFFSAYEAGFCGTGYHEQLCKLGISNIIVHPGDIPCTDKQRKNKTDLHDSRSIAENLEKRNLHGIHVMPREQQELRSLFRLRESKVCDVTRATNRLKGFLMYYGVQLPEGISKKESFSKKVFEWLDNLELAATAGTLVKNELIECLKYHRAQKFKITKLLREQIQAIHGSSYNYLLSVPGIGPVTAMALLAEIGDPARFDDPDDYISFIGLTPWNNSSGESIKTNGIQPRCNKHLRPLLVEASWMAIKCSPELFAYYSRHAVKSSKHAIIKVARRLALIARAVVMHQKTYNPDYLAKKQNSNQRKKVFGASTEKHINKEPVAEVNPHRLNDMLI